MSNAELNNQLYEKMSAEQARFHADLLKKSPEEVIGHAYEYAVRADVMAEMEALDLSDEQASVLLRSKTPLADIFKAFQKNSTSYMNVICSSIEDAARIALQNEREKRLALRSVPLYRYSAEVARENGELDAYRASRKANIACKEAIEAAITSAWDGMNIPKGAAKSLLEDFGVERVQYILANTLRLNAEDERFSGENMDWANTISVYGTEHERTACAVTSHPAKLDSFVERVHEEIRLRMPLTNEEIRAEAQSILTQFQSTPEPNSPDGMHYVAQILPEFATRANHKDTERMRAMLPFHSLAIGTMDGREGIVAEIDKDENRNQQLRHYKPSGRSQHTKETR